MNLFKILCVVKWAWLFLSRILEQDQRSWFLVLDNWDAVISNHPKQKLVVNMLLQYSMNLPNYQRSLFAYPNLKAWHSLTDTPLCRLTVWNQPISCWFRGSHLSCRDGFTAFFLHSISWHSVLIIIYHFIPFFVL